MVSGNIITIMLALASVMCIGAVIAAIVLIASKTFKGTTFWAGVLTSFIASIIISVITLVLTYGNIYTENNTIVAAISAVSLVIIVLCMAFAEKVCIKNKSAKGALSFAGGFGAVTLIGGGYQLFSIYMIAAMINNGTFDSTYTAAIKMGTVTEEQVMAIKHTALDLTTAGLIQTVAVVAAQVLLMVLASILIMKGVTNKKLFPELAVSAICAVVIGAVPSLINNEIVGGVIALVISLAGAIYAAKVRTDIKEPEPAVVAADSFIQTVEAAKQDDSNGENTGNKSDEFNPYK